MSKSDQQKNVNSARQNEGDDFSVVIKELPTVHVAVKECKVNMATGEHSHDIGECFKEVSTWAKKVGHNVEGQLVIGIPQVVDEQLVGYECCVQVAPTAMAGTETIQLKDLPGGKYALIHTDKRPEVIGAAMQCFFQGYLPQHQLEIDDGRPEYEIYYEHTVDQCIPIR